MKSRYQTKPITDIFKNTTEYKNLNELAEAILRLNQYEEMMRIRGIK